MMIFKKMRLRITSFCRKHRNANSVKIDDFVLIFKSILSAETVTGAYVLAIFVFSARKSKKDNMRKRTKNTDFTKWVLLFF